MSHRFEMMMERAQMFAERALDSAETDEEKQRAQDTIEAASLEQ